MIDQTKDYNSLIPPSNPKFPWVPQDWQVLCYYCNQPIHLTKPYAAHRQRSIYGWEHVGVVTITDADIAAHPERPELKIFQKHMNGSHWHCDPLLVRPTNEIDEPRCHICGTQEKGKHGMVCSAAGKPPYRATSLSNKEEELIRIFGWTRESETVVKERQRVSVTEAIGALAITGVLLGVLGWLTGSLPKRRLDV